MEKANDSRLGVIVVDHGSRRSESNELLLHVAELFSREAGYEIVEPAHMELAEPTLQTAFDRCVQRGATLVVVFPYFLGPGRHWLEDIPALAAEAARRHPQVRYLVTAPLGLHPLMARIIDERIRLCLAHAQGQAEPCSACQPGGPCRIRAEA